MNTPAAPSKTRSRLTLVLIAIMFLSPFILAWAMFFGGWKSEATRNYGELLQPPIELAKQPLQRADGSRFAWQPERHAFRFLVAPGQDCAQACATTLDTLHRLWLGQGRKADRVEVLWFGALPPGPRFRGLVEMRADPALTALLPQAASADALPVYLVDPNGFLVLHYRPGFDPAKVRKDLGKLVK